MIDFQDLMAVKMHGDDLKGFVDEWEMTFTSMKKY